MHCQQHKKMQETNWEMMIFHMWSFSCLMKLGAIYVYIFMDYYYYFVTKFVNGQTSNLKL
jgi:hypothetical protein